MSWSVSGKVTGDLAKEELEAMKPGHEIGEGAGLQLEVARNCALDLLDILRGEEFNVTLSGHSQADMPGSAPDSITISVGAITGQSKP